MIFAVKSGKAAGVNHSTSLFKIIDMCESHGIAVEKAYMHTFANGVTTYSVHTDKEVSSEKFYNVRSTANLLFALPEVTFLDEELKTGKLSVEEVFYLLTASRFAYYFMYQWNEDFENLFGHLSGDVA